MADQEVAARVVDAKAEREVEAESTVVTTREGRLSGGRRWLMSRPRARRAGTKKPVAGVTGWKVVGIPVLSTEKSAEAGDEKLDATEGSRAAP